MSKRDCGFDVWSFLAGIAVGVAGTLLFLERKGVLRFGVRTKIKIKGGVPDLVSDGAEPFSAQAAFTVFTRGSASTWNAAVGSTAVDFGCNNIPALSGNWTFNLLTAQQGGGHGWKVSANSNTITLSPLTTTDQANGSGISPNEITQLTYGTSTPGAPQTIEYVQIGTTKYPFVQNCDIEIG